MSILIGKQKGKKLFGEFEFTETGMLSLVVDKTVFSEEVGELPECPSGSWEIDAEDYQIAFEAVKARLITKARFVFGAKN